MKNPLLVIIALIVSLQLSKAQTCDQFINSANGKKLVYSIIDTKGKNTGTICATRLEQAICQHANADQCQIPGLSA